MKKSLAILERAYKAELKDIRGYCKDRNEVRASLNLSANELFISIKENQIDAYDDFENSLFDAGVLAGFRTAMSCLKSHEKDIASKKK